MSREALILAPQRDPVPAQEEALAVSRWVSHAVAARLLLEGVRVWRHPSPLRRDTLSLPFSDHSTSRGVAFFGHGGPEAVFGEDAQPLLDLENCQRLEGAWFFAYACRAGVELVAHATQPAAAGYDSAIIVDFQPELLSGALLDAFTTFITTVPSLLAAGETHERRIKQQLEHCAERVTLLLLAEEENGNVLPGIEIALQQLINHLVVRSPTPEE